jgi:hypothetical protein
MFRRLGGRRRLSDFWARYSDGREELLVATSDGQDGVALLEQPEPAPADRQFVLRVVEPAELAASRTWIANWQSMLPCIVANRKMLPRALQDEIVQLTATPKQLLTIARAFAKAEPIAVRGAVFALLHEGRLHARRTYARKPAAVGA